MPRKKALVGHFIPEQYTLENQPNGSGILLTISGRRVGRPSSRLTLHQRGLRVRSAKLTYTNKNKIINYDIHRINHLPSFEEVRLHSAQPMYPGQYQVHLVFSGTSLKNVKNALNEDLSGVELRAHIPSIDEPAARTEAKVEFK